MKNVQLFEEFVNEGRLKNKDLKELQNDYYRDAEMSGNKIYVTDENPWDDGEEYTFSWDGENAYCEGGYSDSTYSEPVTNAKEFSRAMDDTNNWE